MGNYIRTTPCSRKDIGCIIIPPIFYSVRHRRKNYTYVHINLLLITSECGNSHYFWIKNLSRLVLSQISNSQHKKYFCDGCLLHFSNENLLFQHQQNDCNHLYTSIPSREIKRTNTELTTHLTILFLNLNFTVVQTLLMADVCGICEKPFLEGERGGLRDHCHLTGKIRFIAHYTCYFKL
ncbi:hypothetical protein NQ318_004941 [Aromia moschata]|uniref:C2H2-type domain-containing protein n=1 Tax=Aromia moschata TaxID=1265417 RepID=A0AAV8X412_9CUCU|nr:hypothetical protein NQ318_004941 [Aromia moschata]